MLHVVRRRRRNAHSRQREQLVGRMGRMFATSTNLSPTFCSLTAKDKNLRRAYRLLCELEDVFFLSNCTVHDISNVMERRQFPAIFFGTDYMIWSEWGWILRGVGELVWFLISESRKSNHHLAHAEVNLTSGRIVTEHDVIFLFLHLMGAHLRRPC